MTILGVFGGMLFVLIPTAIVALIVAAAIHKEKGDDGSRFSIGVKSVYTYIVIIATLFMIISGTIVSVSSLLDYFLPESEMETIDDKCNEYYSNSYCNEDMREIRIRNEKNSGITEFAGSLALVIVAAPIFVSHSREVKRLRNEKVKEKAKVEKETTK